MQGHSIPNHPKNRNIFNQVDSDVHENLVYVLIYAKSQILGQSEQGFGSYGAPAANTKLDHINKTHIDIQFFCFVLWNDPQRLQTSLLDSVIH